MGNKLSKSIFLYLLSSTISIAAASILFHDKSAACRVPEMVSKAWRLVVPPASGERNYVELEPTVLSLHYDSI